MRGYWASRQPAIIHDLAFRAASLVKLQGEELGPTNSKVVVISQTRRTAW